MVSFATNDVTVLLAGAGAGKTTKLLSFIEKDFDIYRPEDISLVSFTRKGSYEGKNRLIHAKSIEPERLLYFRTLHSLSFFMLGLKRSQILNISDIRLFNQITGFNLSLSITPYDMTEADRYRAVYDRWRSDGKLDYEDMDFDLFNYKRFVNAYETFKYKRGKLDFTDCLIRYVAEGNQVPVRAVYIDEAQDLTALQWKVVQKAFSGVDKVVVAGDDYQSIYTFAGARPDYFIDLANRYRTIKLEVSYRLPRRVYAVARAITDTLKERVDKDYVPFRDYEGHVSFITSWDSVLNLVLKLKNQSWLILFRFNSIIPAFHRLLHSAIIPYFNHNEFFIPEEDLSLLNKFYNYQKEGYRSEEQRLRFMTRYGITSFDSTLEETSLFPRDKAVLYQIYLDKYGIEKLNAFSKLPYNKRITVSTIHKVKGSEADNVALFLDATRRTTKARLSNLDEELRLLYVAVTRAKKRLYFVSSLSTYGIDDIINGLIEEYGIGQNDRFGH